MAKARISWSAEDRRELWRRWRDGEGFSDIGRALDRDEREEVSVGLGRGDMLTAIALKLGRATSTVSREVAKNGGRDSYRAVAVHKRCQ